jgi:hypothetical protein
MELNPVTARLVELMMRGEDVCGGALLERIAAELNHPQPEVVIAGGLEIMAKMRDRDVILGTRRMP